MCVRVCVCVCVCVYVLQTILFTTDEEVLCRVAHHDDCFQGEVACCYGDSNQTADESEVNRPNTGDSEEEEEEGSGEHERPFTAVSSTHLNSKPHPPQQLCGKGIM